MSISIMKMQECQFTHWLYSSVTPSFQVFANEATLVNTEKFLIGSFCKPKVKSGVGFLKDEAASRPPPITGYEGAI